MPSNPKFSILCTCFNHEKYVSDCIKSILAQTYRDFELIIVDDCSTDNSAKIIKSFKDKRIKLIQHNYNKGVNASLNTVFNNFNGEYIVLSSTDDMLKSDYLETVLKYIENNDICALYCNVNVIDENSKLREDFDDCSLPFVANKPREEFLQISFMEKNPLYSIGVCFKREFAKCIYPFAEGNIMYQDYRMNVQFLLSGDIEVVPNKLACYRIERKNRSSLCGINLAYSRDYLEVDSLMDLYLSITDIELLKRIFKIEISQTGIVPYPETIRYFLGRMALLSPIQVRKVWGYHQVMKAYSENLDVLHQKYGLIFKDFLNIINYFNVEQSNNCEISNQIQFTKLKYTFWQKIFSLRNYNRYKYLCILGIKIKFKRKFKYYIVRLQGGLGNQMFQYAFGLALKAKTGKKVLFDTSWFDEVLKLADSKNEFANGVAVRKYELDIFNKDIPMATQKYLSYCENRPEEKNAFIFDDNLFKQPDATYFSGYFQNEKCFKRIKKKIKKEFTFPQIAKDDDFNQNWLRKIDECENPVFIHLRRGDYLNLQGWALTTEYYKKAIQYIKEHVKNPTFFVFGQDCEGYIKNELLSHPELVSESLKFEIIGEKNSQNKEDWKDIALMMQCKHAIIANSTFSWWAAWLGRANEQGIVVAPTPFVNGQDEIICDNWVKMERN